MRNLTAFYVSLLASGIVLFVIGAEIALLTGRSVWFSGVRQVLIEFAATGITYGVEHLLGVSIAG